MRRRRGVDASPGRYGIADFVIGKAEAPAVAKRAPPRRRKLPRAKYQLLGDGLRARFRSQWLRLTALACCFLVCKWVLRLGFLPTLLLMFTVRWFIMNPLPEKKTAEKSS